MKTVTPFAFEGYSISLAQIFGKGPMFHVTCGDCRGSFSQRIPMVDNPGLKCPHCSTINIMPLVIGQNIANNPAKRGNNC